MMERNLMRLALFVAVSFAISACGGGGGSSLYGGGAASAPAEVSKAASVEVLTAANSVGTGSGEIVAITAVVKDAGNNGLANTAISFSTGTGTLTGVTATTDDTGVAKATFAAGADRSNRIATISATSGSAVGSVQVSIENTKLAYSGATTFQLGAVATLSIIATDSKGTGVPNVPIAATSSLNNTLSVASATTDASGQASFIYTAINSGSDTVSFSGIGAKTAAKLTISGEDFSFSTPSGSSAMQVVVAQNQTLTVTYRQSGAPVAGRAVSFAATLGVLSTSSPVVTNASGQASVTISSSFAGSSLVTASLAGGTAQASVPLQFIATQPSALVLQVSPTALAPNSAGSTTNQATVLAKVTDASANPVTGVTVNFSQAQDISGGQLSQASAITDSNGQASVKYISGPNSTSSGGVIIRGTVAGSSSITNTFALTVNQAALFIALGTGNTIENLDTQTYKKNYTVYVTDANSVAVSGVTVTMRALPQAYGKGRLFYNGTVWTDDNGQGGRTSIFCGNEDLNFNGVLDPTEDRNFNGSLEPGNVISVSPGVLVTDSSGRATLSLIYAESYAPWVQIRLEAQATVSGTASSTSSTFVVQGLASDFTDESVPPAGRLSPFGVDISTCANSN